MLEAGQRYGFVAEQIIADFHNRGRGVGHGAEKFQAHGARVFGHGVQHESAAGDDAVGAFFLHTGQAGEKFVGDVFAEADFAEFAALNFQPLGFHHFEAV